MSRLYSFYHVSLLLEQAYTSNRAKGAYEVEKVIEQFVAAARK